MIYWEITLRDHLLLPITPDSSGDTTYARAEQDESRIPRATDGDGDTAQRRRSDVSIFGSGDVWCSCKRGLCCGIIGLRGFSGAAKIDSRVVFLS